MRRAPSSSIGHVILLGELWPQLLSRNSETNLTLF